MTDDVPLYLYFSHHAIERLYQRRLRTVKKIKPPGRGQLLSPAKADEIVGLASAVVDEIHRSLRLILQPTVKFSLHDRLGHSTKTEWLESLDHGGLLVLLPHDEPTDTFSRQPMKRIAATLLHLVTVLPKGAAMHSFVAKSSRRDGLGSVILKGFRGVILPFCLETVVPYVLRGRAESAYFQNSDVPKGEP